MRGEGSLAKVITTPMVPSKETLSKYQYSHAVVLKAESLGTANGFIGEVLIDTALVTVSAVTALAVQLSGGDGQAVATGSRHTRTDRRNILRTGEKRSLNEQRKWK
jgi:hypothetical protein